MGDGSWRVRKEAVDAFLAGSSTRRASDRSSGCLRRRKTPVCAILLSRRLSGWESAVPVLSLHMEDEDHDVRKFVVDILGNMGDVAAVPLLIKALDDRDPNVSAAAAENLGKIGDARAIPNLVRGTGKRTICGCGSRYWRR